MRDLGRQLVNINKSTAFITPQEGDLVYDPLLNKMYFYAGEDWVDVTAGGPHTHEMSDIPYLTIKKTVRVVSTSNITLSNVTTNIDDVNLNNGDRILVTGQATPSENGLYDVSTSGAWTRSTDFLISLSTLQTGAVVPVQYGTDGARTIWIMSWSGNPFSNPTITFTQPPVAAHTHFQDEIINLDIALAGKSDTTHNHNSTYYTKTLLDAGQLDTRYYTETESNTLLSSKANSTHTHTQADVTNLVSDLAAKASSTDTRIPTQNENDALVGTSGTAVSSTNKMVDNADPRNSDARTPLAHNHDTVYYTKTLMDAGQMDTRYYTETEINTQMSGKANSTHTHAESDVTNLVSDLAAKAPLASPTLTGTPAAPTAGADVSTTQIATTAFVQQEISNDTTKAAAVHNHDTTYYTKTLLDGGQLDNRYYTETETNTLLTGKANSTHTHAQADVTNLVSDLALKANLASPSLTGTPLAPTAAADINTTQIATTAFVQQEISNDVTKAAASHTHTFSQITDFPFPWIPIFQSHVNLQAAPIALYPGHLDVTANLNSVAASPAQLAVVMQYIDPADYAITGKTMQMRVVASFMQNAVANAATNVMTAGLYPVIPGGATTTFLPTYGAVIAGSTAARTGGAASAESRVLSTSFTAPTADHYALAVNSTVIASAGATVINLRLEYRYV